MSRGPRPVLAFVAFLFPAASALAQTPLSSAFTYQGQLIDNNSPSNGTFDIQFKLFDEPDTGAQQGSTVCLDGVAVSNGLFTVPVDFGVLVLNGEARWLQVAVRPDNTPANCGAGVYTDLTPRQPLTATPYALQTRGLFVDPALKVGVGTTTPAEKLNVNGNLRIDDGLLSIFRSGASAFFQFGLSTGLINILTNTATGQFTLAEGTSAGDGSGFIELYDKTTGATVTLLEADVDQNGADGIGSGAVIVRSIGTGGPGGQIMARNNDGASTITLTGGASGNAGSITMSDAAANTRIRALGDAAGRGGELRTNDETGNYQSIIQPDIHGSGVFVFLARDTVADGLAFDGNAGGSGNPRLDLFGANPVTLNTSVAGNGSVALPADAIASPEIFDEPGVANHHLNSVALGPALASVASRTITVPAPGFVLVLAQGDLQINHTAGLPMNCNYGVSASAASLPIDQDVQTQIPAALTAGTYDFSASAHGLFEVAAAGAFTYFFVANKSNNADTASLFDIQLTLVYFPTAYGPVTSNFSGDDRFTGGHGPAPDPVQPDDAALARAPLTVEDIAAEQAAAAASHAARMEREMAQMRQQLAAMQDHLEQLQQEQGLIRQLPPEPPTPASKTDSPNGVPMT